MEFQVFEVRGILTSVVMIKYSFSAITIAKIDVYSRNGHKLVKGFANITVNR